MMYDFDRRSSSTPKAPIFILFFSEKYPEAPRKRRTKGEAGCQTRHPQLIHTHIPSSTLDHTAIMKSAIIYAKSVSWSVTR